MSEHINYDENDGSEPSFERFKPHKNDKKKHLHKKLKPRDFTDNKKRKKFW